MNEKITINDKILQYGILSSDEGYQMYVYPGMTVQELAFDIAVTIKLLKQEKYIKSKKEFLNMVNHYYSDPQHKELKK